jgi:uncharacterized protein YbbC (DUF1343 family)
MRNLTAAALYPCVGLLEATNLSVGRGTDQPFEIFGAPWIESRKLAKALNDSGLPGLRFVPIEFTPNSSKFKNEKCNGIYVIVTDRAALQPVMSGLTIAWTMQKVFAEKFEIDKVVRLMQNDLIRDAMKTTDDPRKLPALWKDELEAFKASRAKHLLYP